MSDAWKIAKSPNYETNKDKLYPYSEMPFEKEYKLVTIPICVKNLIEHVDYYGCGRRKLDNGTIGFPDCYNVAFCYKLVPDGPDKGRKIPNRIPILEEGGRFDYTTRNYIKDNSVLTVTVDLQQWSIIERIAQDIARIVNSERGKVIIYGCIDDEIECLIDELKKMKQLFYCPIYLLPNNLHLTYWKTCYRAYLGINELKRELYRNVNKGDIEAAVILTGCLNNSYCDGVLGDVVNKLLEKNLRSVIEYAYKLWNNYDKDVVRKHFPSLFQHMFDGDCVAIVNQNNQALVLQPNTTKVQGVSHYKPGNEDGWKIIPILDENNVLFKLFNVRTDMYLQQASDATDSKELRDKFYFEPLTMKGQVAFKIFCFDDDKPLELPVIADSSEVKADEGHNSVDSDPSGRSTWILTAANQEKEESVNKDELTLSDDEDFSNIYNYD